jgi:hypothetical protein
LSKTEEADMTDLGPDSGTVLLVVPEDADHFTASVLEKLEHRVITCHGPTRSQHCPLVHGQGCAWYNEAHGVVFALDLRRPEHVAIVRHYEDLADRLGRELPIRVIVPAGSDAPSRLGDVPTWYGDPTVAQLDGFAALVEATDRSR